ncbi:MauE/DoxX family redox-associated membrane protein [Streptomyces goshikiensis]|uniref:MauE/DoxX family redox-associated membrane protein n=1 Tax=Streptomyces goshikiensis TaxID=1942 RepID=UPI003667DDF4
MGTYLEIGTRCLIGTVFLVSSLSKSAGRRAFEEFVGAVRAMPLPLGPLPTGPVAGGVLLAESAVAGLLLAPSPEAAVVSGFVLASGLLAVFTSGILLAVRRGSATPCRCFGASATPMGVIHALRNGVLLTASLTGIWAVAALHPAAADPRATVAAGFTGLVTAGLVAAWDAIAELFRPVTAPRRPRRPDSP